MKSFLTKREETNYRSIKDYIIAEWGQNAGDTFEQRAIDFLDLIEKYPEVGIVEVPEKQIRSFLITKQTRSFYRIKGNQIIILALFDTRRDPKKKPK